MLDLDYLVDLLNCPGAHSGTDLGECLGVSRVAVQKKIQAMVENGLPIKAVSGKGYSLESGVSLLSNKDIVANLKNSAKVNAVEVFQSIDENTLPTQILMLIEKVLTTNEFRLSNDLLKEHPNAIGTKNKK